VHHVDMGSEKCVVVVVVVIQSGSPQSADMSEV